MTDVDSDNLRRLDPERRLTPAGGASRPQVVRSIKLFTAEWPAARAAWRSSDPPLYAVTPEEPVDRLIEEMPTAFGALVRSILHQQVSTTAGRAIITRLVDACGGVLDAGRVVALSELKLRRAGLSRAKIRYVQSLAQAAADGTLRDIEAQPDEEILDRLIRVPGIGTWTVRMFLIFHLRRPDVFSGADLGLREGIRILDGRREPPGEAEAEERAAVWRPYRSLAAVVLWDLVRRTRARR